MNIYEVCYPEIKTKAAFSCHIKVKTNKIWRGQREIQNKTSFQGGRPGVRSLL